MADSLTSAVPPFADRHIGPIGDDRAAILSRLGYESLEALVDAAVPASIRQKAPLGLPPGRSETEVLDDLGRIAARNQIVTSMIGQGYYDTITPPVILRNVLENPGWYTAYTPYQPEISQGRLEALLNFQTMVSDLTALPLTNASLLDEGTAAAEAMTMARRISKVEGDVFLIDRDAHPQTIDVVTTRAKPLGIQVIITDLHARTEDLPACFGMLVQYPGSTGALIDLEPLTAEVHAAGGVVVVATDLLALTLLRPPGDWGVDIAVGSAQRFGVPMGFGGPHAGFLSCLDEHRRTLPGRLVGVSVDAQGRPALRLALQTREQHIRREKATSNICTAQVLLANMASFYAVYHGPDGLSAIARGIHQHAEVLATGLRAHDVEVSPLPRFDTVLATVPGRAAEVISAALDLGINLRLVDEDHVAATCDEVTTERMVESVWTAFGITADYESTLTKTNLAFPDGLIRTSTFLEHPVFHDHRSETELLRYLRKLCDRDIALDRSMIPLGSCTMKLNATAEMIPVTWPAFGRMHPFAPLDQAKGYLELIHSLEDMLVEITGYDAVSLQPNAGSQGEYAGLLAIMGYLTEQGQHHRDVCLIPSSAHGTNAASAAMVGMRVIVVACDDRGNIDLDDLRAKLAKHEGEVAVLMVTYPSTHGVYEESIGEVCELVHAAGGQVYLDGANLNALVGVAQPGQFGADVSHLNLHKTFCIPHGGGGPGVGPVAVRSHLAPYLPGSSVVPEAGPATSPGAISAAPWGSASILPISWAYIALMGAEGLLAATQMAIANANYVAARLNDYYPVLYTGANDLVAHECILDLRPIKEQTGVTVDDVAKRLIDFGFHAPTMSFPVAGTLMVEPTESESLAELDRFCDAMIAIRAEIDQVGAGVWPADDNPLHNAPHTAEVLVSDTWNHAYSREVAAYPVPSLRGNKYWCPVGRIDSVHGDRNLICSCPPPEAYAE